MRSTCPVVPIALALLTLLTLLTLAACGGGGGGSGSTPSPGPTLSAISPNHGPPGTRVALSGSGLGNVTAVAFNGASAFSFTLVGSTQIDAVVPGNATTGPVQVSGATGSAVSPTFTVEPFVAPTLTGFAPSSLSAGRLTTLTGTHLVGTTQVLFHGASATSFTILSDTQVQAVAPAGLTAGTISVTTPGGTAVSTNAYTLEAALVQVLMNSDFEQASPLIWQGDTSIIQDAPGSTDPGVVAHSGSLFAWLGGYGFAATDQITQDFYIPATAQSATLTFYLKIISAEPTTAATDTLTVAALDTTGASLGILLTRSNLNASDYTACTADLLPYKGRTVRLSFKSQEDAQRATSFLLDDVVANLTVPAPTDLKPLITSFTPTSGLAGETSVRITGGNFFGLTSVSVGGLGASYTLPDGTSLSATVPGNATIGSIPISLTNLQGTGLSTGSFSVLYGTPTVTGVNPTQGPVGTPVVLTGTYLGYSNTTLTLNGLALTPTSRSATQITFTVPPGATSGSLVLTSPGGTVTRTFTVNTATSALDLHIEKVQFTQSVQTLDNAVAIVAGKKGLVRVFVLANQANAAAPAVRITLLNNGAAVAGYPKTVAAPGSGVPLSLDPSLASNSWNLAVPATDLTTPLGTGYGLLAEVDPAGAVAEADETNNSLAITLRGAAVPAFKTTIFPVVLTSGTGDVTPANKDAWAARLAKMYPLASVDVAVGAAFTGSVSTLSSDGTGWSTLLSDLATKHQADGASDRYYFGALSVSYGSGVAGLGYVPSSPSTAFSSRTALGWDKTGLSDGGNFPEVFAHETGHNMGCRHSPCPTSGSNVPSGIDPAYPYAGGLIGQWGYDTVLDQWKSPLTFKDIMAYCSPVWISDYTYQKVFDFRGGTGGFLAGGTEDTPLAAPLATLRECLLVRGLVHEDGQVELLPAFRTRALPTAAPTAGDYTLTGLDAQGAVLFTAPLTLTEVGCSPKGHERHFVVALPLEAPVLEAVTGLSVLQAGQVLTGRRGLPKTVQGSAAPPEARRLAPDRIQVRWDATLHPAALVRDADTGEVIAILGGGSQTLLTSAKRVEVVLSDGVSGPTHRLETPAE